MLDNIFQRVAQKHKVPKEQVELVYRSFTDGIRYYIVNYLVSKTRITIPYIGRFEMTYSSVKSHKKDPEKIQSYFIQFRKRNGTEKQHDFSRERRKPVGKTKESSTSNN